LSSSEQDAITVTRDAGVATITLNRPKVKNALTPELFSELGLMFDEVAAKPPIALSLIKTGMNRLMHAGFEEGLEFEADAQATCLGSEDFRAAMIAWLKKTEGEYVGE